MPLETTVYLQHSYTYFTSPSFPSPSFLCVWTISLYTVFHLCCQFTTFLWLVHLTFYQLPTLITQRDKHPSYNSHLCSLLFCLCLFFHLCHKLYSRGSSRPKTSFHSVHQLGYHKHLCPSPLLYQGKTIESINWRTMKLICTHFNEPLWSLCFTCNLNHTVASTEIRIQFSTSKRYIREGVLLFT